MKETHPPETALTAGKFRHLMSLADGDGVFRMVALDQRRSLARVLAKAAGTSQRDPTYEEISNVQVVLARVLAPDAGAILVDPVSAHTHALADIPGTTALVSPLVDDEFDTRDGDRLSRAIEDWSVAEIKRSGAAAVQLLVWHRPDLAPAAAEHQDALVSAAGEACREHDIPLMLVLRTYPREGEDEGSLDDAVNKPERVLASVEHFADDAFGLDLLAVEFPCDLKRTKEYASGAFDGVSREAAYDLKGVAAHVEALEQATNVPWVLSSAGSGHREFFRALEIALAAGASGFSAGRAAWLEALSAFPDLEGVEADLAYASLPYLRQLSALAETGVPWWDHPRYGGTPVVAGGSAAWSKDYGA